MSTYPPEAELHTSQGDLPYSALRTLKGTHWLVDNVSMPLYGLVYIPVY